MATTQGNAEATVLQGNKDRITKAAAIAAELTNLISQMGKLRYATNGDFSPAQVNVAEAIKDTLTDLSNLTNEMAPVQGAD